MDRDQLSRVARPPARWRRALLGPVGVTAVLTALTALTAAVLPAGFVLAWLLVGLTAGYALSGSA